MWWRDQRNRWNVETLKEFVLRLAEEHDNRHERAEAHLEALHNSQRNEVNIAILGVERLLHQTVEAIQIAVAKAETANEKRFESVNEFRNTLGDQQAHFVTRVEIDSKLEGYQKRLQDLTDRMNLITGKGVGLNAGWTYLIAAIGAASALLAIWMKTH
jgi:hypothetical protein